MSDIKRIWVINPNSSQATTERLRGTLEPRIPRGVELSCLTARLGAPYIACEASHAVAGYALLDAWQHQLSLSEQGPDRILIGCFGDPGLFALRESSACPVTGLAEASFIHASKLGQFAIVTGGDRWKPMLERLASGLGYAKYLTHIETVQATGAELQANPEAALNVLKNACYRASLTGAQSIILGGAGLAGYAEQLHNACQIPIYDSVLVGLEVLLGHRFAKVERSTDGFDQRSFPDGFPKMLV